jgi:hypothetical protein
MFSISPPKVVDLPQRVPLEDPDDQSQRMLELVMHEYDAIRSEIDVALTNQVSALSFGAATVGLLVAAAAALWEDEPLLSGLLLLVVVPATCMLALTIYSGDQVRLMRAGLFMNDLENWVNTAGWKARAAAGQAGVLVWEQWQIREGPADVDRYNRRAIVTVFVLLAVGFMLMGFYRLSLSITTELHGTLAILGLVVSSSFLVESVRRVKVLGRYAYAHRKKYEITAAARTLTTGSGDDGPGRRR